jgi:hypothetical protein
MLDIVAPFLAAAGIAHARLDGSMSAEARAAAVQRFTHDPACTVFALSLKAGGVGLHLVAATHVWLLDPCAPACAHSASASASQNPRLTLRASFALLCRWWNPMVEQQAFERCHRLGQTLQVTVHRLYVADSVEQSLVALQERKRTLAASTLAGDIAAFNKMDLEDLKMLFGHKRGGGGAAGGAGGAGASGGVAAGIAAMAAAAAGVAAGAAAGARRG